MELKTTKCKNCKKQIKLGSFRELGFWEPDYDEYSDPIVWRHAGTGYAACGMGGSPGYAEPVSVKNIYVASSWRNSLQETVVKVLRAAGYTVYDFKNPQPNTGFGWQEVMPSYVLGSETTDRTEYLEALEHPRSVEGFESDMQAMEAADLILLVLDCGKSAHLELGWAAGAQKLSAILMIEETVTPELMYKMVDKIVTSATELLDWIEEADAS